MGKLDKAAMAEICSTAVRETVVMSLEEIFEQGVEARSSYCIMSGTCRYTVTLPGSQLKETRVNIVLPPVATPASVCRAFWVHSGHAS